MFSFWTSTPSPTVIWAGAKFQTAFIPPSISRSHAFCAACNRVRLTSTGVLKPCLCYEEGTDLRSLLRGGCTDEALARAMAGAIRGKPPAHCFAREEGVTERRAMFQIGG